jgi:hypothetical protein
VIEWFYDGNHWILIGTLVVAAAAIAQFDLTRRTAQRQLRAYVLPEGGTLADYSRITPRPHPIFAGKVGGVISIKNSGQTPAYDLLHWSELVVLPLEKGEKLTCPPVLQNVGATTVGPGSAITKTVWSENKISKEQIQAIESGTSAVFVHGRITYRDAFNKARATTYRLYYAGSYPPPEGVILQFTPNGNRSS